MMLFRSVERINPIPFLNSSRIQKEKSSYDMNLREIAKHQQKNRLVIPSYLIGEEPKKKGVLTKIKEIFTIKLKRK